VSAPSPAEAEALLARLTRALAAIAVLALVFTAVNVTLFAVILLSRRRGVFDVQHEPSRGWVLRGGGGYLRAFITWIVEVRCSCNEW
jgi:hypothetical protein